MKQIFIAFLLSCLLAACSSTNPTPPTKEPPPNSVIALLKANPDLSTFAGLLEGTDLEGLLAEPGTYTVFAPTNAAFAELGTLPEGDRLREILFYHVVDQELNQTQLREQAPFTLVTTEGRAISVALNGDTLTLNETTTVQTPDVEAENGVIHVVTGVLTP
jgi:transforming growth factor-beta-induced protein